MALSYDEPDALADFAAHNGITFPLLSDPDSAVIRSFGILNTLVPEDDHPWFGIPFPGTYVTDAAGVITAKFFERNLAHRVTGDQLLRAALGEAVDAPPSVPHEVEEVTVEASFDPSVLPSGLQRDLVIDVHVPPGQHVYGLPVPDGMVHTHVELDDGPWRIHRVDAPPTVPHVLAGTGDELRVYEGSVRLHIAVSHNGSDLGDTTIGGFVRWQACDDEQCFLPGRQRFDLPVVTSRAKWMRNDGSDAGENFARHFGVMRERRAGPQSPSTG